MFNNRFTLLSFIFMGWFFTSGLIAGERGFSVKIGDPAPAFSAKLADGSSISAADFKNKVVMLQFTASWCGVCRVEMPHIEKEIWQVHKDNKDFILLGIDLDEPANVVNEFAQQTGISYPLALDPQGKIFGLFTQGRAGVTRNVIIDRQGKIAFLTRLFDKQEFAQMKQVIDRLLQAKK